jgi:hypothetical protein
VKMLVIGADVVVVGQINGIMHKIEVNTPPRRPSRKPPRLLTLTTKPVRLPDENQN